MAVPNAYTDCPKIQEKLNGQFTEFNPTLVQDALGYLSFLMSPLNTSGMLQRQIDSGSGKIRKVELTYQPRFLDSEVTDDAVQSCAGGAEQGDLVEEYTIDPTDGKSVKWTITNANLVERCEGNDGWFEMQIIKHMEQIMRSMDKDLLANAALNFGKFSTTSFDHETGSTSTWAGQNVNPGQVRTRKTNGDHDPRFLTQIKSEFRAMNANGTPVIIGDNLIDAFITELDAACCATSGLNLAELASIKPVIYMRDENVEAALGVAEFIGMVPGAVQLLTFNEFRGEKNQLNDDTYVQGTLVHPISGIMFDYLTKFDCGVWTNQLKLAYKPVYLPGSLFQATDKLDGVNWLNNFKVVN